MKISKKVIISIIVVLETCLLSSCYFSSSNSTESSSKNISTNTSTLKDYVVKSLEEKYGLKFEVLSGSSPMMTTSVDFDVKCIDNGVEFEATVRIKDKREMISENYLCKKYKNDFVNELKDYVSDFFTDFKLGNSGVLVLGELPFDTKSSLSYREVKAKMVECHVTYQIEIYIPDSEQLTQTDVDMLRDKFSNKAVGWYKSDLKMNLNATIYTFPKEDYDVLDIFTENMLSKVYLKSTRIL